MAKPLARPFISEKLARKLRLFTGVVMFVFVCMHFFNHALLLVSETTAERMLVVFKGIWRSPPGTVLLYGSFATHFILALRSIYLRRHFDRRLGSVVQVLFGLLLPVVIASHVISARMPVYFNGADSHYDAIIRYMWANDFAALKMVSAVLFAWTHGCIGIYSAISHKSWFRRVDNVLFAIAVIFPTLTLVAIYVAGQRLAAQVVRLEGDLRLLPPEFRGSWLAQTSSVNLLQIEYTFYSVTAACGAFVLILGIIRKNREKIREITVTYAHGHVVHVPRGTSVLEASEIGRVDHYSACGGKGRCSTCRVRVMESQGPLPPPNAAEQATLTRIQASPDTRLSCQLKPDYDLVVELQLLAPKGGDKQFRQEEKTGGKEKDILVMFSDLRNFTTIAESKLPYDILFMLNSYFSILVKEIEDAGGRVDKYIGDGVMAIFDVDERSPDEVCQAALKAAARIVAEMRKLNKRLRKEFGIDLEVAIGMHYGPAIVGVVGFGKVAALTAIGDTVNVASRLENVAKQFNAVVAVSETVMLLADVPHDGISTQKVALKGRRLEMPVMLFSGEQIARYR